MNKFKKQSTNNNNYNYNHPEQCIIINYYFAEFEFTFKSSRTFVGCYFFFFSHRNCKLIFRNYVVKKLIKVLLKKQKKKKQFSIKLVYIFFCCTHEKKN